MMIEIKSFEQVQKHNKIKIKINEKQLKKTFVINHNYNMCEMWVHFFRRTVWLNRLDRDGFFFFSYQYKL